MSAGPAAAAPAQAVTGAPARTPVWDLPLRLFHWSLALAVAAAVATGEAGGDWMVWHGRAGLFIAGLLVFRLVWGFAGSPTARFRNFLPSWAGLRAYVRGEWRGVGHSPLGALAVFALLGTLALLVATGLFGTDDIAYTGPLFSWVTDAWAERLTRWHRQATTLIFALVGLHVAAIAFYAWVRGVNLVRPMIRGWKEAESKASPGPEGVRESRSLTRIHRLVDAPYEVKS